jgi:copper chaperone CopZ
MAEGSTILNVYGVYCEGCASNVRNALLSVKGVKDVEVGLEEKKVKIHFDTDQADEQKLKKAVRKAGYVVA